MSDGCVQHCLRLDGGCGSVGRAVATDIGDPRFESSHRQFLFTINCTKKTKRNKKEAGNAVLIVVDTVRGGR